MILESCGALRFIPLASAETGFILNRGEARLFTVTSRRPDLRERPVARREQRSRTERNNYFKNDDHHPLLSPSQKHLARKEHNSPIHPCVWFIPLASSYNLITTMFFVFGFHHFREFSHWDICSEKSRRAVHRENEARAKFDSVRKRVEHARLTNVFRTVLLGCSEKESPFCNMPEVATEMIFDFIKPAGFEDEPEAHAPVRNTKKKYVPPPSIAAAAAPEDDTEELELDEAADVHHQEKAGAASRGGCRASQGWNGGA
eukprot:scaffold2102_cov161-Amphora_coffeaeformis.AAC.18